MRRTITALLGLCLLMVSLGAVQAATEGEDYERLRRQNLAEPGTDRVEVVEVFWYGCPHCYTLEPMVAEWLERRGDEVNFVRVPATLNRNWEPHARAFYVAQALDVFEQAHPALFRALHEENKRLDDRKSLAKFFTQFGVEPKAFNEAWDAFGTQTRLRRDQGLIKKYRLFGVPAMVVDGQYLVTIDKAGSYPRMLEIVDELIAQAQPAAAAASAD